MNNYSFLGIFIVKNISRSSHISFRPVALNLFESRPPNLTCTAVTVRDTGGAYISDSLEQKINLPRSSNGSFGENIPDCHNNEIRQSGKLEAF